MHQPTLIRWLPFALVSCGAVLLSYTTTQQSYRQGANDPQIQLAEDAAAALNRGVDPQAVLPPTSASPDKSLAPFMVVTDASGKALGASSQIGGKPPVPPKGSLDYAKKHGENRFTWQPESGVRLAAVVTYYGGSQPGYVIAARNLREVESREAMLSLISALGLLGLLAGSYVSLAFVEWASKEAKKEK